MSYIIEQLNETLEHLHQYSGEVTPIMVIREIFFGTYIGDALQVVPAIITVAITYWFVRRTWHKKKLGADFKEARRRGRLNEIVRLLLVCWITGIVTFVIMPANFWSDFWYRIFYGQPSGVTVWSLGQYTFRSSLLDHIKGLSSSGGMVQMMFVGNIALFVPLGLALPFVWKRVNTVFTVPAGFLCSLAAELIQPLCGRNFDIDDIVCNTFGVFVGYIMYLLIRLIFSKFTEKCKTTVVETQSEESLQTS